MPWPGSSTPLSGAHQGWHHQVPSGQVQFHLKWGLWSVENDAPQSASGFGDPALPQHLPWVAEVTRTVVTQRLQSAAAKRAMAKARGGYRALSGLWGAPRPSSPGYHGLAHQPEGGQESDTRQVLASASPQGICFPLVVESLPGPSAPWGAHCSRITLTSSGPSSPVEPVWEQLDGSAELPSAHPHKVALLIPKPCPAHSSPPPSTLIPQGGQGASNLISASALGRNPAPPLASASCLSAMAAN